MEQINKVQGESLKHQIAALISRMAEPIFWLPVMIWVVIRQLSLPAEKQLQVYIPLLIFIFIIPFSLFMHMVYVKKEIDIDISRREQRIGLTMKSMVSFAMALPITYFVDRELFTITCAVFFSTLSLVLVTLKWKISFHGGLNTLIFYTINYLYGWRFWWIFLLLIPIGWARLVMRKHNLAQLIAGISLSAAVFTLVINVL